MGHHVPIAYIGEQIRSQMSFRSLTPQLVVRYLIEMVIFCADPYLVKYDDRVLSQSVRGVRVKLPKALRILQSWCSFFMATHVQRGAVA
jgi:hypothetical protein